MTDEVESNMINSLTRIAKDLERAIIGIYMCAGLLGLIAFLMLVRIIMEW